MQAIIDRLDAQFADPGYKYALLRREDWQTLKSAVLAQQTNNSAMDATCDTIECPDCGAEFSVDCECPICKGHWLRHKRHQ